MPQSKIIFVNRVYWPNEAATAQLLTDLANALVTRGWPVHVVTSGNGSESCSGVSVHRVGGTGSRDTLLRRFWHDCRFLLGVRRTVKLLAEPGDVVVLKTDPPLLAVALTKIALARGARVLHWIQDIYPEIVPLHAGRWISPFFAPLGWLRNRAWRGARHCLVPSADMRPMVEQSSGPAVSVTVIPNWAPRDLEIPATDTAVDRLRSFWGISGKFVVAYSGNLGRVHEFETLLRAATLLRNDDAVIFAIVGDGPRLAAVEAFVTDRALLNVRFFPKQPRTELSTSLAVGDVHLVTLRPGFERLVNPSKLAGVLAVGRPAFYIGADGGATPRLIADENCGRCFRPGDAQGLATALSELKEDTALRRAMGTAARSCFERHFRFECALREWDLLLHQLTAKESTLP